MAEFTLTLQTIFPSVIDPYRQVLEDWAADLNARSNDRIAIEILEPGQLVNTTEIFDAVSAGILSLGLTFSPTFQAPELEVFEFAFAAPDGAKAAGAAWATTGSDFFDPSIGVELLATMFEGANGIAHTVSGVDEPSDFLASKIVTRGGGQVLGDILSSVGASRQFLAADQVDVALQSGLIDGAVISPDFAIASGVSEAVTEYLMFADGSLLNSFRTLVINADVLNSLPSDLAALIRETTGEELSIAFAEAAADAQADALAAMGDIIRTASAGEEAAWRDLADLAIADRLAELGQDARDLYNTFQSVLNAPSPTDGDDVLAGTAGPDDINALAGDDRIDGDSGGDTLRGGDGNDVIRGDGGGDMLFGGQGRDDLRGGDGRDEIQGGNGADKILGNGGDDRLAGGNWHDQIFGGDGADWLSGNKGDDGLVGGKFGDSLFGGDGRDELSGFKGNDVLNGGKGRDELSGGFGADRFVFGEGWGDDLIADFKPGADKLDFSKTSASRRSDLDFLDGPVGVTMSFQGDSVILTDVNESDLRSGDFIF